MSTLRALPVFVLLVLLHFVSRLFYRFDFDWIGEPPSKSDWSRIRLAAILNHTSLFEVIWAGCAPLPLLWRIARHGVVPVADKTLNRPIAGFFFRAVAQNVVSISRSRDATWDQVMSKVAPGALVVILPEGRMMRGNGLDKDGKPMTLRGGIADILKATHDGWMLLAYSGGLHHVQTPGERLPRLFKKVRMRFEAVPLSEYVAEMRRLAGQEGSGRFKREVVRDLTERRDRYCWPDGREAAAPQTAAPQTDAPRTATAGTAPSDQP